LAKPFLVNQAKRRRCDYFLFLRKQICSQNVRQDLDDTFVAVDLRVVDELFELEGVVAADNAVDLLCEAIDREWIIVATHLAEGGQLYSVGY
jgi:hypothetical protein